MREKCWMCGKMAAGWNEYSATDRRPACDVHLQALAVHDQSPPKPSTGDVWQLVIADMEERRRVGIERYGTPLQPHNGRDALVDAYQESLDKTVYLRQAIEERPRWKKARPKLPGYYWWRESPTVAGEVLDVWLHEDVPFITDKGDPLRCDQMGGEWAGPLTTPEE